MLHEILMAMVLWPLFLAVGYYLGRWTPARFHHCFQEAKAKVESQTNAEAVKIAEDLADARKQTIQELQEKLENVENELLDLRHGLLSDGDSGIHGGSGQTDRRDPSHRSGGGSGRVGIDDTGSDFRRGVFRFQDTFRGKCGDHAIRP